jgi:hypothetical protein
MAIDFPSSPTTGQIFTAPNGTQWTWDSVKWTQGATSSGFLPLAGGTMTGDIVLAHDPPAALNPATKQYVDAANIRYKNRIINGDMSVDQRNGGNAITASAQVYAIDRWHWWGVSGKGTIGQGSTAASGLAATGFSYLLNWGTTTAYAVAAADNFSWTQAIEGYNFNDAQWGTANAQSVVLEFWAASSLTGTFTGAIRNSAQNRSYVFTYTISAAATWKKIRLNIPGDTTGTWAVADNALAAYLSFNIGAGANWQTTPGAWTAGTFSSVAGAVSVPATVSAYLVLTGVALMVGSGAANAEPEFKKYSDNLIDCQRYYQRFGGNVDFGAQGYAGIATGHSHTVGYLTTMRGAPTATIAGTWTSTNAGTVNIYTGLSSMMVQLNPAAVGVYSWYAGGPGQYLSLDADF